MVNEGRQTVKRNFCDLIKGIIFLMAAINWAVLCAAKKEYLNIEKVNEERERENIRLKVGKMKSPGGIKQFMNGSME
jgi:hypothetical protein